MSLAKNPGQQQGVHTHTHQDGCKYAAAAPANCQPACSEAWRQQRNLCSGLSAGKTTHAIVAKGTSGSSLQDIHKYGPVCGTSKG